MSEVHLPAHSTLISHQNLMDTSTSCASTSTATLKRAASESFESDDQPVRKRLKEDSDQGMDMTVDEQRSRDSKVADELSEELQCGCCSELVYRPVLVMPCQHFFCGSCCSLWIRNGGTNCPACRGISTVVTPFRALQGFVDTLVRLAPQKARTERERQQADEIYTAGTILRIPSPKELSPEPNLTQNPDLAYPCPHCPANNPHGWRCPQAIVDPVADPDHAWHLEDGNPPGHGACANCDNILALEAPVTSKCDFCQLHFCGINIPGRCSAAPLPMQHPHGFTNIPDLIESAEIYDSFEGNTYEVELVFDYLRNNNVAPRNIYRSASPSTPFHSHELTVNHLWQIVGHVQQQPRTFIPLVESDVFSEIHGSGQIPQGPFNRICRACASDVLLWGLKDWWIRERKKGLLDEAILRRPDCANGSQCQRQKDAAHAREFNHVIAPPVPQEPGIHITEASSSGPAPLAASTSVDVVANLVMPPTQPTGSTQNLRSMSTLSFLLNASDTEEAATLPTIAQVLHSSSASDIREAIDAFTA
ncbi:hypothetical protein D9611_008728 [Ephemerocybe angulata]|uniref:RING-type domain-containing protein n=1 Tax=Ephemerocybe angulata TaxID=980116 RepID=A0A8H5CD75_9AGAR|nr:hypothetical protein D9611_008728 [Tulosesus angulatus]